METVAQSATWSDVTEPVMNAAGAIVTDGLTGTPTVTLTTLRDSANADRRTGAALTYAGDGGYRVTKPIPADGALGSWWGVVTYNDGAGLVRPYSLGFEVITAARALSLVTIVSPVTSTGNMLIVRGDDRLVAHGNAYSWSSLLWTGLTGATASLTIYAIDRSVALTKAAIINSVSSTLTVELTRTETPALPVAALRFALVVVRSDATVETLVTGTAYVRDRSG